MIHLFLATILKFQSEYESAWTPTIYTSQCVSYVSLHDNVVSCTKWVWIQNPLPGKPID